MKKFSFVKSVFVCGLLLMSLNVCAQTERAWEVYLNNVMTAEDVGSAAWEETHDLLCELEQHPLDLNAATREELEELTFLTAQQVEEIMLYLYRYGPMKSLNELMMIRSLDYERRRLLTCFVCLGEASGQSQFPSLKTVAQRGKHELMATGRIPFYERKGDEDAYQGYPYRHWLRYQFAYGDYVKAGLVGAQDAGEPFFAGRNTLGYDYYSFYLQLRNLKRLQSLVLGKYRVSMGMGMVINNSFALGKLSTLQNLGRSTQTLRAHSSRSAADYLQGGAATVRLTEELSLTGFLSYRAMDATLNKDGTAATILTTGYHRTDNELEKKNNLGNTTYGGSLRYQAHGLHLGLNAVGTHLSRELKPNTTALYRQHYAKGQDFLNASADYGYVHHRFSLNGETAVNRDGALATINTLSLQLGSEWSLMALQRFYSYRYSSLYASSFSDGGHVQNESGAYLGLAWQPSPRLKVMAYADCAYFPWAKYQVSQSSHAWDQLLQLSYNKGRWTLGARYRLRLKQRDNADKTALVQQTVHRGRLSLDYADGHCWSSRTQGDYCRSSSGEGEQGFMLSQSLGFSRQWLRLNGGLGYFHTDSYEARLYLYEQAPAYQFSFPMCYGEGLRYWLMGRAELVSNLTLTAKLGTTNYFDRATIGTDKQLIDHSSMTDLDLQLTYKF